MNRNNRKGFTLVEIMIVVVIIGLLAAMAIPAFQKVRQTSQQKTILNNLRQYGSAAQQYMLDNGVTTVSKGDIVGDGLHITNIKPVAGEPYDITVTINSTQITTSSTAAGTITYNF